MPGKTKTEKRLTSSADEIHGEFIFNACKIRIPCLGNAGMKISLDFLTASDKVELES